jgi:hypothetical protein
MSWSVGWVRAFSGRLRWFGGAFHGNGEVRCSYRKRDGSGVNEAKVWVWGQASLCGCVRARPPTGTGVCVVAGWMPGSWVVDPVLAGSAFLSPSNLQVVKLEPW